MRLSALWLCLALSGATFAQAPAGVDFPSALIATRYPLLLTRDTYSGPGATILNDAVAQSRFVLVGEDHITRETPRFVSALCEQMHPDIYAVEAGPFAAKYVQSLLERSNRVAVMTARDQKYPSNMAFLNIREESDLAAHCAASSHNPNFALWGLDQEFLGSAGLLLAQMAATNPGPKSNAAIAAAQVAERADAAQAQESGKFEQLFLNSPKSAYLIRRLNEATALDGKLETRKIAKELSESWNIYTLNAAGDLGATLEARAEILKQHFLTDYLASRRRNPNDHILFKLGDNHTVKGFNETHDLNLGDFVAQVAAAEQVRSLHILVLGLSGMHFTMPAYSRSMGQEPFVLSEDPYYAWVKVLPMDPSALGETGTMLTLFDLRKLRYRHLTLPPEWERVIYGNDLLIVFPRFSVASEMQ